MVLVTGGNRGIGLACARAFATQGDRVAITYRTEPVEGFTSVRCDVSSADEVDAAFREVEERLGKVEVLVANAGITKDNLVLRMSDEDFVSVVDTNLAGAFPICELRRFERTLEIGLESNDVAAISSLLPDSGQESGVLLTAVPGGRRQAKGRGEDTRSPSEESPVYADLPRR